jgi:hypothetical protein
LTAKLSQLQFDNSSYDLVLTLKSALGQKLVIQDSDSGSSIASLSTANVNLHNKAVLGLAASTDSSSAVPLSTLSTFQPQNLRAKAPSNTATIYSNQQLPIAEFTSNDIVLKKPARYNPRPNTFQSTTLTDVQQVNAIAADYQLLSGKDQPLGYAGLDTNSRIYANQLPLQAATLTGGVLQTAQAVPITTTAVPEGSSLYYTDARVN